MSDYDIKDLRAKLTAAEALVQDSWSNIYGAREDLEEQKKLLPTIKNWPYYQSALKAFEILDEVKNEVDVPRMISDSIDKLLLSYN